ncbi:MAG TPA: hypothetical protein VG845_09925 [Dehalococcoidia bacterium]|nr:hypothetical protein [Dehalococcoidia bacterium]
MTVGTTSERIVADVKCYYCGHISGQIHGRRHQPLKVSDFVPRPGYAGPEVKPGMRLRCERCRGPVFLEDATSGLPLVRRLQRKPVAASQKSSAA